MIQFNVGRNQTLHLSVFAVKFTYLNIHQKIIGGTLIERTVLLTLKDIDEAFHTGIYKKCLP